MTNSNESYTNFYMSNANMHKCVYCGNTLKPGVRFCPVCGNPVCDSSSDSENSTEEHIDRQIRYDGVLLKCPNCGAPIDKSSSICPSCGYHIVGRKAVSSITEFKRELMSIETNRDLKGIGRKARIIEQKVSLIRNFPIPNTIDDIKEFMLLALSNIDIRGYLILEYSDFSSQMNAAWDSKMQQAYEKARIQFETMPEFNDIEKIYTDYKNTVEKGRKRNHKQILLLVLAVISAIVLPIVITLLAANSTGQDIEKTTNKLYRQVDEIQEDIKNGNYEEAYEKAEKLDYPYSDDDENKYWKKKKKALIRDIKKKADQDGVEIYGYISE